jgi:hypothetical protein
MRCRGRGRGVNRHAFPTRTVSGTQRRHDAAPRFPRHALLRRLDAETAHGPALKALSAGLAAGRGGGGPDPRHRGPSALRFATRSAGCGLRQGCGGGAAADAPRLRLRRGPAPSRPAAARQSAPRCSACRRMARSSTAWASTMAGWSLSRPAPRPVAAAAGGVRRQYAGEQGGRRPARDYPASTRARRPRPTTSRQRLLANTRASATCRGRSGWRRSSPASPPSRGRRSW